jgi:MFS family permease
MAEARERRGARDDGSRISREELPSLLARPASARSYAVILLAGLAVFTMGGIVPGLNSLYSVLYVEGVFASCCTEAQRRHCAAKAATTGAATRVCCDRQEDAFALMSSLALFASDGVMLLYGELLDRLGARWCCGAGLGMSWLGFVLLAANALLWRADALWFAGFFCVGIAGPGIFMGCLSFGECYPSLQPLITALAACMWDSSSMVFLLFRVLYFDGGLSFGVIAALWLGVIVVVGATTWSQLPTRKQLNMLRAHAEVRASFRSDSAGLADLLLDNSHAGEDVAGWCSSTQSSLPLDAAPVGVDADAVTPSRGGAQGHVQASANDEDLVPVGTSRRRPKYPKSKASLLGMMLRADTALLLVFMAVYNLKSSFYIVSLQSQLATFLPPTRVQAISTAFNFAFPLGGMLSSIPTMLLLQHWRHCENRYMSLALLLACAFSLSTMLPEEWSQYFGVIVFGPTRTLQWAAYFCFLEQPDRYPPRVLGRMIGYGNLIIALIGDGPPFLLTSYVQYAAWPPSRFGRYQTVHIALTAILVCTAISFPIYLSRDIRFRTRPLSRT